MWKKYSRSGLMALLLLINLSWSPVLTTAAELTSQEFNQQTWQTLLRQSKSASIVVFTTTDCSHCPAVVEYLAQYLKKQAPTQVAKPALQLVVMDGQDEPEALKHGHYLLADKLWVFQGNRNALQYSVNPKWRGLTPYVALLNQQQTEFVIGKPDPDKLSQFLARLGQ